MHLYVLAGVCHAELFSHRLRMKTRGRGYLLNTLCSCRFLPWGVAVRDVWGGGGKKNQTKYMKAVMNYSDLRGRCGGGGVQKKLNKICESCHQF